MYNICIHLPRLDTEAVRDILGKCDKVYEMIFMMKREFFKEDMKKALNGMNRRKYHTEYMRTLDGKTKMIEVIVIDGDVSAVLKNAINAGYVNMFGLDKMIKIADKTIREIYPDIESYNIFRMNDNGRYSLSLKRPIK